MFENGLIKRFFRPTPNVCLRAMERLINRRQQGDLGEASAIEWLTSIGAAVLIPFGHSPHFDLVAEIEGRLLRVQVKTSVFQRRTPGGHKRWEVSLTTNGGNQSWTGVSKKFDARAVDFLFALVGDGRRWFIPSAAIEVSTGVTLGGPTYSEFEITRGRSIQDLVYRGDQTPLESDRARGSFGVWRTERACKVRALRLSGFESHLPHHNSRPSPDGVAAGRDSSSTAPLKFQRTRISSAHQITIPSVPFRAAGLNVGDRLHATADGAGRVVLERIEPPKQDRLPLSGPSKPVDNH